MKTFTLTLAFICLAAVQAVAQFNATITVTDLGTGAPLANASVSLDGNFLSTDAAGQAVFTALADNTYDYSVSAPCYASGGGSVTIAGADAASSIALEAATTNSVFFFIGSPMAIVGSTVNLTNGEDYFASFVTSSPFGGDFIEGVPYGEISYTITTPCYETVTGTVTVECNNGDGIAVFAEPVESTTNTVFFFIGSPLAITGATVQLTDGADYNATLVTSSPFGGDVIEGVPFGEYSYTISIPCYETVTGSVTVECNNGDGIAVFAEPAEVVLDVAVTLDGATLTAAATGVDYQWVDCDNDNEPIEGATGQSFTANVGNYAVIITSGSCSQTSDCETVIGTAVADIDGSADLVVYPNPFQDVLTIRTTAQAWPVRVELFSTAGQLLLDETYSAAELITLSTAQLAPGSYVLRLNEGSTRSTMSVVK